MSTVQVTTRPSLHRKGFFAEGLLPGRGSGSGLAENIRQTVTAMWSAIIDTSESHISPACHDTFPLLKGSMVFLLPFSKTSARGKNHLEGRKKHDEQEETSGTVLCRTDDPVPDRLRRQQQQQHPLQQ